ncbi:MAG: M17 family peptidase N-terminal domain-containing protein [Myxococcota bacterium]|nr:M17 family peptidase N-terminal domain-containing protein [Myxococcota bacterium]
MSVTLPLMLEERPVSEVPSDGLVAPCFEDELPLRGPAGFADWRLCGMLSRRLSEGRFQGASGEALLVPTLGRMRTPRVLLLGLGPRQRCSEQTLRAAGRDAALRLLSLGSRVPALALPPERSLPMEASSQVRGWVHGVADALAEQPAALALRIVAPEGEGARLRSGLTRIASRPPDGLVIRLMPEAASRPETRPESRPGGTRVPAAAGAPHPRPPEAAPTGPSATGNSAPSNDRQA